MKVSRGGETASFWSATRKWTSMVHVTSPPPLGIRYQQHAVQATLSRRLTKNLTTRLQYGYYYYAEPSLAGANDYRVHSIFGVLSYHLP